MAGRTWRDSGVKYLMSEPRFPGHRIPPARTYRAKRAIDLAAASAGLVLLAPLLALIALAIRVSSRGSVLFIQERIGWCGRPFRVIKFRTMRPAGPSEASSRSETSAGDPRITPIGRWLRRTGLDELPQLVNVLRGEMSLVGPRPLLAWEIGQCDARQRQRLAVRPGISGLSQVRGRNAIPWAERIEWDLRYVEAAGFGRDLGILLGTIPTVLFGRNAYAVPLAPERPAPGRDGRPSPAELVAGVAAC
jgi:lipopolysaccharide/colanic/teichoic acid biosynthesis glycosyltransferase